MKRVNGVCFVVILLSAVLFLSACQPLVVPTDGVSPGAGAAPGEAELPDAPASAAVDEAEASGVSETAPGLEDAIANAMSAAPPPISQDATILGFPEGWPGNWPDEPAPEMVELQAGSNGWTCIVDRPDTPGNDPMCLNDTMLENVVAQRRLEEGPSTGIGIGYMLQGGGPVGSPPHIMVFTPESNASNVSFTRKPGPQPWVMFPDTSYQHLMVLLTPPGEAVTAEEDAIANAMSAAPPPISQDATILGFPEEWPGNWPDEPAPEMVELRAGSNGWTCIVDRPDTPGNDPMCLNDTMLENVVAQRRLEEGPSTGIGIGYMLQGGGPVGSPPHVMILTPESNASHVSFTRKPGPQPWVMFPDTSYQHLMILAPPNGQ